MSSVISLSQKLSERFTATELMILNYCQLAAELPVSRVARDLGIAEHTVRYSLKRVQERKLVSKRTVVCCRALGKFEVVLLLTLNSKGLSERIEIRSWIVNLPEVRHCSELLSPYDFGVVILVDQITDGMKFLSELADKYGNVCAQVKTAVAGRHIELPLSYSSLNKSLTSDLVSGDSEKRAAGLDEVDIKILEAVSRYPSYSHMELSKSCGVSLGSFRYRVAKLQKSRAIVGQYWVLNPETIGLNLYFIHISTVNFGLQIRASFLNYCRQFGCISFVHELVGAWDITVGIWVANQQAASELLGSIRSNFVDHIAAIEAIAGVSQPKLQQLDALEIAQSVPSSDNKSPSYIRIC
jgi:DNA-binding Lrp family transcriptional regulator